MKRVGDEHMVSDEQEWFSNQEVSQIFNIPNESIRRYTGQFRTYIKVKKMGKKNIIHRDSLDVFKLIREGFEEGKVYDQVVDMIIKNGTPATYTVKHEEGSSDQVNEQLNEMMKLLEKQQKMFEEQQQFNKVLVQELKQQREYIENSIKRRDEQLMKSIRSNQDSKIEQQAQLEVSAAKEKRNGGRSGSDKLIIFC